MRRDQSGHAIGYAGYALLLWTAVMVSIALGILFRHEIRAVLAGVWR
ncbi:MAG: hypothetical protein RQ891_12535 [Thermoflexus sp.]|jgi:hypothetical protein|nr:hypothetical protein [Thermoflexus sp.]MDT7885669.1 hypothetical protein [Thermoflexus sp.]MDT7949747.1 hypothetical protein [Thermoflexus sp.]